MPSSSSSAAASRSGGHDHVKEALASLGVEQVFWRVALKPGKPTWFGVAPQGALVFGLPGNPVSAMVTFLLFVRPAITGMSGAEAREERVQATLDRGPSQGARARPRGPLSPRGARRRLARPADRRPGLACPDLDARRRGAGHRARGRGPARGRRHGRAHAASGRLGSSIAPMTVTVRLFAVLRERAGRDSIEVELEEGATVAEVARSALRPARARGSARAGCRFGWP